MNCVRLIFSAPFVVTFLISVVGCNTTQLETTWKDPAAGQLSFDKVIVVALSSTPAERRAQEEEIVSQIKTAVAVPSYTLIADESLADRDRVKETIRQSGADGAIVLRVIETRKETAYIPSSASYWGSGSGYAPYGYHAAGTSVTDTIVRAEVSLYTVPEGKLLWSGSSTTTNPANARDLALQVVRAAAAEMREQRLLPS